MSKTTRTIEVKVARTIPASPEEVYDAWLSPSVPGTPWHEADKLILSAHVDGLFFWLIRGTPHYGRFVAFERGQSIQHTWMSPNTSGQETTVTVTFAKNGNGTLMTLVHSDLPDNEGGRGHDMGWNYFLGNFAERFAQPSKREAAAR
jgi:uncharacterized protein YndB with AHSA1/START domain